MLHSEWNKCVITGKTRLWQMHYVIIGVLINMTRSLRTFRKLIPHIFIYLFFTIPLQYVLK